MNFMCFSGLSVMGVLGVIGGVGKRSNIELGEENHSMAVVELLGVGKSAVS